MIMIMGMRMKMRMRMRMKMLMIMEMGMGMEKGMGMEIRMRMYMLMRRITELPFCSAPEDNFQLSCPASAISDSACPLTLRERVRGDFSFLFLGVDRGRMR